MNTSQVQKGDQNEALKAAMQQADRFRRAMNGDVEMLIQLGREGLGQTDKEAEFIEGVPIDRGYSQVDSVQKDL